MKILFPLPTDGLRHRYCSVCFSENIKDVMVENKKMFYCNKCGLTYERIIDIDPKVVWWVDPLTKEYWHESVAVFVINNKKQLLFIERTIYPYVLTIPSGHLDVGESPVNGAKRELKEETEINSSDLIHVEDLEIENDKCRRGADFHKWHIYKYFVQDNIEITPDSNEGKNPIWFNYEEALNKNLGLHIIMLMKRYGKELLDY